MDSTRKETELWLIGHPNDDIPGQRLPPQRLQLFSFTTRTKQFMEVLALLLQRLQISWTEQECQLSSAIMSLHIILLLRNCS